MRGNQLDLSRVVLLGYGVSGRACHRFLSTLGGEVVVVDDRLSALGLSEALALGVQCVGDLATVSEVVGRDWPTLTIISPGVAPTHQALRYFSGKTVGEFEFGWRMSDSNVAAITGTNGKTTVTFLVAEMLEASGIPAVPTGNYGLPFIELAPDGNSNLWSVAEASSFQLHYSSDFRPDIAALLNVTPDHLDWHGDFGSYRRSKLKIFANQSADDYAVVPDSEDETSGRVDTGQARRVTFGLDSGDFHVHQGSLSAPFGEIAQVARLRRKSSYEIRNLLAASAVAVTAGAESSAVSEIVTSFSGLEHRVELFATYHGVDFIDDSKATTPASVIAAVMGLNRCVLIAGGRNKGLDLSPLRQVEPHLQAIVAIGESAPELVDLFPELAAEGGVQVEKDMRSAVEAAYRLAGDGVPVILSPGSTSYDWYQNYKERGRDFKVQVLQMIERLGG